MVRTESQRETHINRSATGFFQSAELDGFLYASIGEDTNGMVLTVLSALARLDIDPWDEAAALNRLPRASAIQKLTAVIAALPSQPLFRADSAATAARLIALLPAQGEGALTSRTALLGARPWQSLPDSSMVRLTMIGIVLMLVVQYVVFATAPPDLQAAPSTASVTATQQAPTP